MKNERHALFRATRLAGLFVLVFALLGTGCSKDTVEPTDNNTGDRDCIPGEQVEHFRLPFDLEYRASGTLTFSVTCDGTEGTLVLENAYDVLEAGVSYTGTGKRYTLPESGTVLYTFGIDLEAGKELTCADRPVKLSLSLSTKEGNETLTGGLSAYCGTESLGSRPVRIMRLTGSLETVEETS